MPMATFFFESITAAQALGFTAGSDSLVVANPTSNGAMMTAAFSAASSATPATVTLTDLATGRSIAFRATAGVEGGALGGPVTFADRSSLLVGASGPDNLSGTARGDGLF